jgi:hypothetical protein
MAKETNWSPEEMRVVDRCLRELQQGRYHSRPEVLRVCGERLAMLRRRRGRPAMPRTAMAIDTLLGDRRRAKGIPSLYGRWQPAELRVLDRHAAAIGANRYNSLVEAARACQRELAALRSAYSGEGTKPPARNVQHVYARLKKALRGQKVVWPYRDWHPDERAVARRFARAFLKGRYASARASARACQREMARRSNRPRQFCGVYWMVLQEARGLGLGSLRERWTPRENRILRRYVRLLMDRRYHYAEEAARDCHRALGGSRSRSTVLYALRTKSGAAGIPRYHSCLTADELRTAEKYAMMVHDGRLPHWRAAAVRCHAELARRIGRAGRTGKLRIRHATTHTLDTIHLAILRIAHARNLRGPRNPHWTDAEDRLAWSWVKWYDRYRLVARLTPRKQAAEGLSEDLEKAGFSRKVSACAYRIGLLWRRQQGLA